MQSTVIDIRNMSRQAGTEKRVDREIHFDAESYKIDNGIAYLDTEKSGNLEAVLTAAQDGIFVSGKIVFHIKFSCSRCVKNVSSELGLPFSAFYMYEGKRSMNKKGDDCIDEDIYAIEQGKVDMFQAIYDIIASEMPYQPLCSPDCKGICDKCGELIVHNEHHHAIIDNRWEALKSIDFSN
jgi:uncharacterized protein